jgi:hypothetical protein
MIAVLACQDAVTSPNAASPEMRLDAGNPPPPPIDTGAVGSTESETAPTMLFTLDVTYFFNPPGDAGWLKFSPDQADGVVVDPSAQIHFNAGTFWGYGTVQITQDIGTLTIDLSTVDCAGSAFAGCESVRSPSEDLSPGSCVSLTLRGASISGPDFNTDTNALVQIDTSA